MAIDLCLQVLTYSHVDYLDGGEKGPANTIRHTDMFVLVKGNELDGTMIMTVISGSSKLETVNLGSYVDDARRARQNAESRGLSVRPSQLPISGMTRDTLLGFRFRPHGISNVLRRIQFKLQSLADCRQLIELLQRRGMEIEEIPASARPSTSATRPGTSQQEFRPLTTQSTTSSYFGQQQQNSQQQRPKSNVDRSMAPPIKALPVQDDEDLYGVSPPRQTLGHVGRALQQKAADSGHGDRENEQSQRATSLYETAGRRVFARDESIAPRDVEPSRPSTSQMWRSHTMQPLSIKAYDNFQTVGDIISERPSSNSNAANLASLRQAFEERESSPHEASALRPSSAALRPYTAVSSTSLTVPDVRAKTAAGLPTDDNTKRPVSNKKNNSRPSSSALALPPLRRPSLVKESSSSSAGENMHSRPSSGIPPMQPLPLVGGPRSTPARRNNVQVPEPNEAATSTLAPPQLPAESGLKRRVTPMEELIYGSRPLAERSANAGVQRLSSYADAPHEIESPPASASASTQPGQRVAGQSTNLPATDDALGRVSMTLNSAANLSLGAYAAQSPLDREAALTDFMMENLQNPAFAKLCEDVENCWQRIALGL